MKRRWEARLAWATVEETLGRQGGAFGHSGGKETHRRLEESILNMKGVESFLIPSSGYRCFLLQPIFPHL